MKFFAFKQLILLIANYLLKKPSFFNLDFGKRGKKLKNYYPKVYPIPEIAYPKPER